jgi:hypothetical protein
MEAFNNSPESKWLTGYNRIINEDDKAIQSVIMRYKNFWLNHYKFSNLLILNFVSQPATFWRKELLKETGFFNEKLHYTMDYDYWLQISKKHDPLILREYLSGFRIHGKSKGGAQYIQQFDQDLETCKKHTSSTMLVNLHKFHNSIIKCVYRTIK